MTKIISDISFGKIIDFAKTKIKSGASQMLVANVINKAVTMISSMIITRLLTKSDYGIWTYALNLFSYLTLISGLGLISGCVQFGTENKGEGKGYSFFKYCLQTGILIDAIIVCVGIIIALFVKLPIPQSKVWLIAIMPSLLFDYVMSISQGIFRSKNKIGEYARMTNINTIVMTVGTCVGAVFGLIGVVIGRYIGRTITLMVAFVFLKSDVYAINKAERLDKDDKHNLWHYSLFTGASSAMNCLVYYIDVSLIASLIKSADEIGIYKVGTMIPNALQFIPTSIVIAVLPTIIYNKDNIEETRKYLKKIYLLILGCNVLLTAFVMIFAPLIIRIISGEKYIDSVPVLRVLILGYFFSGTFRGLSVNTLAAFRRVKFGLLISVVSCVTDIVFNYFFILSFGMIGAAYATLLVDFITGAMAFGYVICLLKKGTINALS